MGADSEFLIIGSGPAGAMAAWALRGPDVRMIDTGHAAPANPARLDRNIFDLRREHDLTPHLIGSEFQGLRSSRPRWFPKRFSR
jgi:choline dehydrogenase-like flavoprotein